MRKITITLISCLVLLQGMAQQTPPKQTVNFSLAQCIAYAYEHQDSIRNANLDITSADYKIKEIKGQGLPQVNGTVSFQDFTRTPTSVGPDLTSYFTTGKIDQTLPLNVFPVGAVQYTNTFSLSASQLLFSGSFLVGLQAAKTYKELSVRSLNRSKVATSVAVTKAYYQVLVNNEQVKLLDANIGQLKQQVNETTQSNQQGFVEKIDVDRITVQYNNLVTNRDNVQRALVLGYAMLKFQMGMPIETELTLSDKLADVSLSQGVADAALDTAFYHNRVEYSLLETAKKLNELDLKSKKAEYLPTVVANAGFNTVFQENQTRYLYSHPYPNNFVGLNISVPIFSGFQRANRIKQSQISVQKSQNDLDAAKNGFNVQATAARVTFYNSLQSLENQKKNQALANEVLRVSKIKYQQGVGSSIEVTQAQTALETADNQYIQALYDALINKVNLDQAYGRIK